MGKSKALFLFCLSFISGVFIFFSFNLSILFILGVFILAFSLISVLWRIKKVVVFGFCLILLCLGWLVSYQKDSETDLKEKDIFFEGAVIKEPDVRTNGLRLVVRNKELGKVLVFLDRYPEYNYGDKLRIEGKVEAPPVFDDFDYQKYLAAQGIRYLSYKPKAVLLEQGSFSGLNEKAYSQILSFKKVLREGIGRVFPSPQRDILGAMILGDKNRMPDSLKEDLNITGLRHITAISGMHIIIISGVLISLFSFFFSFKKAFTVSFLLLFLFIVMVGFPYSAVRAGIMALAVNFSRILGRPSANMRILVLTAALMLALNPLLLFYDAGFQLSFLAAAGIIYFKSPIKKLLKRIPFKDVLSMTFSAQILTLPVLIYSFGRISLVSPLSNVLIVPILPFIMVLGFLAGITALFSLSAAIFISFPSQILLAYLVKIVDFFSDKTWASKSTESFSWLWLLLFYVLLIFFFKMSSKNIQNFE